MRQIILNSLFGGFMGYVCARYIFPHSIPLGLVLMLVFWATIINSMVD